MSEPFVVETDTVERQAWSDPVRGEVGFRTLLGGEHVSGDFTAGLTDLPVGGWLGHHRHEPAEVYFIVEGEGVVSIDGVDRAVGADTLVYIPGDSEHGIRNTGASTMRFFYVFATGSFEDVEYRFSEGG